MGLITERCLGYGGQFVHKQTNRLRTAKHKKNGKNCKANVSITRQRSPQGGNLEALRKLPVLIIPVRMLPFNPYPGEGGIPGPIKIQGITSFAGCSPELYSVMQSGVLYCSAVK